jgi:ABC-2 type transport system permease protein
MFMAELKKKLSLLRTYYVDTLMSQILYILAFILLSGLSGLVTDGNFSDRERTGFFIGFMIWWVAVQSMSTLAGSIVDDAKWGTLEQVRISGLSPVLIMAARSASLVVYFTLMAAVMGTVLILINGISIYIPALTIVVILITWVGTLGLGFMLTGLNIVHKNASTTIDAAPTILFFLTGVLAPFPHDSILHTISQFAPLTIGISLAKDMVMNGLLVTSASFSSRILLLILNTAVYFVAGWITLQWAFRRAQEDGSLAHY